MIHSWAELSPGVDDCGCRGPRSSVILLVGGAPAQLVKESGVPKSDVSLLLSRAGSQGGQLRWTGGLELISACRWVNLGPRGSWG